MDTKLKNSKLIGNFICILLVCVTAVVCFISYPCVKQGMKNRKDTPYDTHMMSNLIERWNYALYTDVVETRLQKDIDPMDAFDLTKSEFTEEEKLLYENLDGRLEVNDRLMCWKNELETSLNLDYAVVDDTNHTLVKSYQKDNAVNLLWMKNPEAFYDFYVKLQYDANGNLSIQDLYGANKAEWEITIANMNNDNILEDDYDRYFSYDYEDESSEDVQAQIFYDNISELRFSKPENITIVYGVHQELQSTDMIYEVAYRYDYNAFLSGGFVFLLMVSGLFIFLISLLLPMIRSLQVGTGVTSKISLELLIAIGFGVTGMIALAIQVGFYTISGDIMKELLYTGMGKDICDFITWTLNLGTWVLYLGGVMAFTLGFRQIFVKGLRGYLKENVWIIAICRAILHVFKKCYHGIIHLLDHFDLKDKSNRAVMKLVVGNGIILLFISCFWIWGVPGIILYSIVVYIIACKYIERVKESYQNLLHVTNQMADGNLNVQIKDDFGVFWPFKEELEKVQHGFKTAVEQEVKSQNMKTELITNVSHDLKTPLTAIITYVDLLKNPILTEEERESYIETLEMKSLRLKRLIEDLFEVSKASSKAVDVKKERVDIVSLIKQAVFEQSDKLEAAEIEIRYAFEQEKLICMLDSQKTYRIFDNLIVNITRYAMPKTRAYIEVKKQDMKVVVTMKNVSAEELAFDNKDIMERFVRGDKSRHKEGSGLGLAIVKSFMELQNGTFEIETDGDLFKAILVFPYEVKEVNSNSTIVEEQMEKNKYESKTENQYKNKTNEESTKAIQKNEKMNIEMEEIEQETKTDK